MFSCPDLSDLLQLIAEEYNDLDIRDRARFYHQLMLTVSADKVCVVLTPITPYLIDRPPLFLVSQLSAILTLASDSTNGSSLSDIVEGKA